MFAYALPWIGSPLAAAVVGGYLAAGAATAALLARRGQPPATLLAAVPCWPLLLPLLYEAPASIAPRGPLADTIDEGFRALAQTLADPAAGAVPMEDVEGLRAALLRADGRLALVDRLLSDPAAGGSSGAPALRAARERVTQEIGAVLAELVALRVQVGLLALAGDSAPVQDRLRGLRMRLAALEELSD